MDQILRGRGDWQAAISSALRAAPRPIRTDPRFQPRSRSPMPARASMHVARPASTLLLVYPGGDGRLTIPLTVRHADLRAHAGEVSLPGGASDPDDPSREATALREAREEVGLDPSLVTVLGHLDDIWIPVSNFELRPFVATAAARPPLTPSEAEVTAIVELPLELILGEQILGEEEIVGSGWRLRAAVYRHAGQRIWGATARTLAMFAAVLREAG